MFYTTVLIEWWNDMTGADVVMAFLRECADYECIVPDGMHLASDQSVLTNVGSVSGECDLTVTVAVHNENERDLIWDVVKPNLMSEYGVRIKSMARIPDSLARAGADDIYRHIYSEDSL
jgi:hypothetical protein